jgi:hypothetical protein
VFRWKVNSKQTNCFTFDARNFAGRLIGLMIFVKTSMFNVHFMCFLLMMSAATDECVPALDDHYIRSVDFIASGYLSDVQDNSGVYKMTVVTVYKGADHRLEKFTLLRNKQLNPDPCYVYLIYASRVTADSANTFTIDECSRTARLSERRSTDERKLIDQIKRNGPIPTGACTREYSPVCGCNGVTYGNSCEARVQNGIARFTEGECERR